MQKQYYYDFNSRMHSIKNEIYTSTMNCDKDKRVMSRHIDNIRALLEERNRAIERQLSSLRNSFYKIAQ